MTDLKQSDDWSFYDEEGERPPFWTREWEESKEYVLVIWPVITESGTMTFSYGHAYDDEGYYEFQQIGHGCKNLQEAKKKCEAWGENNTPEDV